MSLLHTLIFGAVPEGDRGTEKSHLSCEHLPVPVSLRIPCPTSGHGWGCSGDTFLSMTHYSRPPGWLCAAPS